MSQVAAQRLYAPAEPNDEALYASWTDQELRSQARTLALRVTEETPRHELIALLTRCDATIARGH